MYALLKVVHILGVIVLIGNVTVTAVWKVFADRTGDNSVRQFAQRLVTGTDWTLTLTGIAMILIGGYGMTLVAHQSPWTVSWLVEGQILFAVSGSIWAGILVPAQIRLARAASRLEAGSDVPPRYLKDSRVWLWWGVAATVPLVVAVYVMVAKT